jgi:hypothetical protein
LDGNIVYNVISQAGPETRVVLECSRAVAAQPTVRRNPQIVGLSVDSQCCYNSGDKAVFGLIYLRDLPTLDQNQAVVRAGPYVIRIHRNA